MQVYASKKIRPTGPAISGVGGGVYTKYYLERLIRKKTIVEHLGTYMTCNRRGIAFFQKSWQRGLLWLF